MRKLGMIAALGIVAASGLLASAPAQQSSSQPAPNVQVVPMPLAEPAQTQPAPKPAQQPTPSSPINRQDQQQASARWARNTWAKTRGKRKHNKLGNGMPHGRTY
jgi:hypothetical protein